MNLTLALVILPVSDVDQTKSFYVDDLGFIEDYDMAPTDDFRIVQLTPPGSPTSIAIGINLFATPVAPGSTTGRGVGSRGSATPTATVGSSTSPPH